MVVLIFIIIVLAVVYVLKDKKQQPTASHSLSKEKIVPQQGTSFKSRCQNARIIMPERQEPQPEFMSSCKDIPPQTDYEAYYKNGKLFDVKPRNKSIPLYEDRQIAYHARYIISDGTRYDLEDVESIKGIAVPKFDAIKGMPNVTHDLSYILKMRVGMENRPHLAVPLAYKVAELLMASPIGWRKKDFYRLVIQLWSIGEIKYADFLLKKLKELLPMVAAEDELTYHRKASFDEQLSWGEYFNQEYVHIGYSGAACSRCAPYQNRMYSLNGKDKRFPQLPDFIIQNKGLHCGQCIYPTHYYDGETITQYIYKSNGDVISKEVDAIKYSNRPFVDDRSEYEKQNYERSKEKQQEREQQEDQYYSREHWVNKYLEHLEYHKITNLLGDKAPKSYSGYRRMKKNNTANFQKIAALAKENGITIN